MVWQVGYFGVFIFNLFFNQNLYGENYYYYYYYYFGALLELWAALSNVDLSHSRNDALEGSTAALHTELHQSKTFTTSALAPACIYVTVPLSD